MSTVLVGLIAIATGFGLLGLGCAIEGSLARGYARKYPDRDVDQYMRGRSATSAYTQGLYWSSELQF